MNILQYFPIYTDSNRPSAGQEDGRYERNAIGDLKHGLDLIFELKSQLDKLHPVAAETLIRLLSH